MKVREVQIENLTMIMTVPKDEVGNSLKKEIRHRLDATSDEADIYHVDENYDIEVNSRDNLLELIITNMDITVHLAADYLMKDVADKHEWFVKERFRRDITTIPNIRGIGAFDMQEHYVREK